MTKDPVVKRVIVALERTHAAAAAVDSANGWSVGGWRSQDAAYDDLAAAKGCTTLADLLTCDRPAVRLAAQLALEPAPPAPKRKRSR